MGKTNMSLPLICLILFTSLGVIFEFVQGQDAGQKTWCVAKPSASDKELQDAINFACSQLGDCRIIQSGGACFNPDNLHSHASVVMNMYYQKAGRHLWNCEFSGIGLIACTKDPSYGSCQYQFI